MKKKGTFDMGAMLTIVVALLIVGGVYVGVTNFLPAASIGSGSCEFSYAGKNMDVTFDSSNIYTAADADATIYIYEEAPEDWENGRVDVQDGYVSSVSVSSGTGTTALPPGDYVYRVVLSGYYDLFGEFTIPECGDVSFTDYNTGNGETLNIKLVDTDTLSLSNVDLGISTNETSDKTYIQTYSIVIDDNEGYELNQIKFQEDGTYSFATDTDGDGVYDEGINKIVVKVNGASKTLFDVAASINEFSGDDEAVWNKELFVNEENTLTMIFEVTCDATLSEVGDADEKCGNSEDFIDSVILVDAKGNTASFDLVG